MVWDRLFLVNLKNAFYFRTNGPEAEDGAVGTVFHDWRARYGVVAASGGRAPASDDYRGAVCLTAEYTDEDAVERLCGQDVAYARGLFA